jgi:hypothetical protein
MGSISKAKNAELLAKAGIPRKSWSKLEFCARHGISEGLYNKMKKLGIGPEEIELLDRILISDVAEAKWLREASKRRGTNAAKVKIEA